MVVMLWKSHWASSLWRTQTSNNQTTFSVASYFLNLSKIVLTPSTCLNALSRCNEIGWFAACVDKQVNIVPNKVTSGSKYLLELSSISVSGVSHTALFPPPSKTEALRTAAAPTYAGIKGLGLVWQKLQNKLNNSGKNDSETGEGGDDELSF